jgi:hypothetical protein
LNVLRTAAIFENLGAVLSTCADIQETIEIGRRTVPADESFTAILDQLQAELDAKAAIMYEALTRLNGIETKKTVIDPETILEKLDAGLLFRHDPDKPIFRTPRTEEP